MQPDNYSSFTAEPMPEPVQPQVQNPLGRTAINPHSYTQDIAPEVHNALKPESTEPVAVVRVLSPRGVEYGMMTIALLVSASTLAWIVLNMLNGSSGFNAIVVPTSALIISLPVLGAFFLRLKKQELSNPSLKLDSSKRRWSQLTQFLAFIACLVNLIYFVYVILQHVSGGKAPSIVKAAINLVVVLAIAGGILTYYWFDEHRTRKG